MFAFVENYLARRRAAEYRRGYDSTVGELLRNDGMTFEDFEQHLDSARAFDDWTSYDNGVRDALHDWHARIAR